ncbi:MAG: chemotaxis protein CheX [Planctomycetaceae bacterium]|jgi:chemotaxis protein CheX|nr:chemotaxis protein CheX [Planctomycetaceae bacterium]
MPLVEVDFINPVISSLEETFETMLDCKLARTGLALKENNTTLHPISGIIGISGRMAIGTVVLSLSIPVALHAASTMLMTEITEPDEDVMDAVGELTNMVSGSTKAKLSKYNLSMGLPSVFHGSNCHIHFPSSSHPIAIPFQSPWGALALEVGFSFMN